MELGVNLRVCVISGSRAEYGALKWTLQQLKNSPEISAQFIITGAHLIDRMGLTKTELLDDGNVPNIEIDLKIVDDQPEAISIGLGNEIIELSHAFSELKPDVVLVAGDRYEILMATLVASLFGIPIAHIGGGETTEGSKDNMYRHAISQMASFHFVENSKCRKNLINKGLASDRIQIVGPTGVEDAFRRPFIVKEEVASDLEISQVHARWILCTIHPATASSEDPRVLVSETLSSLDALEDCFVFLTGSNADTGGQQIDSLLKDHAKKFPHKFRFYQHLGVRRYQDLMQNCHVVVGNSSSGLIEAPVFGIPSVNIGTRQKGRTKSKLVLDAPVEHEEIYRAIERQISRSKVLPRKKKERPFPSTLIVERLKNIAITSSSNTRTLWKDSSQGKSLL